MRRLVRLLRSKAATRWARALGLLVGMAFLIAPDPGSAQTAPDPRAHHQLVYHGGEERVYLIGGSTRRGDGYRYFDDIWSWDGTVWTRVSSLPFPRSSHRIVYHPRRNSLILFGGGFARAVKAEGVLWEWRGGAWKAVGGSLQAGRDAPEMCYDARRNRVVLFGGWDGAVDYRGDTWEWEGAELLRVDSAGPAARAGHALVYDPVRQRCLLFGGRGPDGFLPDMWEWDGAEWHDLGGAGFSPRWFFGSAADPANRRIVVFGGLGPDGDLGDTWVWDGERWERLAVEGPAARSSARLAFAGGAVVLFGGRAATSDGFRDLNDTWELRGGSWVRRDSPAPAGNRTTAPPCRVDELESLAFMLGDWSVRSWTEDQNGEWVETPARATIRTRLSGCLIEEVREGELNGRPYRSVTWLAYDRAAGRWQRALVDDAHGSLLTAEGRWHDGRLRLFVSQFRGGRLLLDRTTIQPIDSRHFQWELESSYDGGATWQTVWRMRYERDN